MARQGFYGLFVELKVGSNRPSKDQEQYLDSLVDQGYCAVVCWGSEQAIEEIKAYLGISEDF